MHDRNTLRKDGELTPVPMAESTEIFGGHLVCANAAGFAVLGTATATLTTLGVADGYANNRTGAAGDVDVLVRRGKSWCFANFGGDAVTQALVGKNCYVADSQTVAATSNTNARPVAGKVMAVDTDGVWVLI